MCDSAQYPTLMQYPMTLEEFLLDCWGNGFHDGAFGHVDEIGWHMMFIGDEEIGYFGLLTNSQGFTWPVVYKDRAEYQSEWEQVEKEEAEFYASDEEAFPEI